MVQAVVDPAEATPSRSPQGFLCHHSFATQKHEHIGGTNPGKLIWESRRGHKAGDVGRQKAGEKKAERKVPVTEILVTNLFHKGLEESHILFFLLTRCWELLSHVVNAMIVIGWVTRHCHSIVL